MDYSTIVDTARERALDYLNDSEGWKQSNKSTDQFKIETKPSKKYNCSVLRIKVTVDKPKELCRDTFTLLPGTRRGEWDADLRETKKLQDVDENTILFFMHTNSVGKGVISPREFVDVARTKETEEEIFTYGCGVEHPAMSTDDKYVRAFNGCWLYKFYDNPVKRNSTCLEMIVESEMKGWIPSALLNSTVPAVFAQAITHWLAFLAAQS